MRSITTEIIVSILQAWKKKMKWHDPELLRNFGCFVYVLFSEAVFECKKKVGVFYLCRSGAAGCVALVPHLVVWVVPSAAAAAATTTTTSILVCCVHTSHMKQRTYKPFSVILTEECSDDWRRRTHAGPLILHRAAWQAATHAHEWSVSLVRARPARR